MTRSCIEQPFEGGTAYFPLVAGMNWRKVMADPAAPLMFTNNIEKAFALTERGVPAIAIVGVSQNRLTAWLRQRGADVIAREGALH